MGVALFVGMLGYCWARHVTIGVDADPAVVHGMQVGDDAFEAWLAEVEVAWPPDAGGLVATAGPEYASSAVRRLLTEAAAMLTGATPADWRKIVSVGQLLRRIVEHGHGTEFSGGELARAHSLMLTGLGYHLSDPFSSQSAYQRAARDYSGRGNSLLGSLAGLGAATSRWAALLYGERDEIRTQLAALSSSDPEVAGRLGPSLDGYLRTLTCIAAIQAGSASMPPDAEADAETVGLLGLAASASFDDVPRAVRLARAADDASAVLGDSGMTLAAVGAMLSRQRRWAEAAPLLEECHARYPKDRDIAEQLADAWLRLTAGITHVTCSLACSQPHPAARTLGPCRSCRMLLTCGETRSTGAGKTFWLPSIQAGHWPGSCQPHLPRHRESRCTPSSGKAGSGRVNCASLRTSPDWLQRSGAPTS